MSPGELSAEQDFLSSGFKSVCGGVVGGRGRGTGAGRKKAEIAIQRSRKLLCLSEENEKRLQGRRVVAR